MALWPPCYYNMPVEAVVLKGNYTLEDLRTVANITFHTLCMESVTIDHATFQPSRLTSHPYGNLRCLRCKPNIGSIQTVGQLYRKRILGPPQ